MRHLIDPTDLSVAETEQIVALAIPLLLGIALGLSTGGSPVGAVFYIIAWNVIITLGMRLLFFKGYELGGKAVDGLGQPFGRHRDGRIAREDDGDDPIRGRKLLIEVQRPAVGRIHGQEIQNVLVAAQREHPGQQERTQHRQQGEEPPPPP